MAQQTNSFLGAVEEKSHMTRDFASSRIQPVLNQIRYGLQKVRIVYEQRQYYGPQIISASTATVASLVTMRRGKIPGTLMGGITAASTYTAVYGLPTMK